MDHELQTVGQLYRTKTRTELNYLRRKEELDKERLTVLLCRTKRGGEKAERL